ncbi:MAG: HAMP domain-containing histidine kinase [Bacteroidetes bacterium]|nr:HAMP domain-containing histidine kinase [Bacteroidota bacterium]
MRSKTLKWIILIATIAIVLLVAAQLFWLNKIYNYEQQEFKASVIKSIQGVYEDLDLADSNTARLQKQIEHPNPNSFLFQANKLPDPDSLADNMLSNLEAFGVFTDCRIALYDHKKNQYSCELNLPATATGHSKTTKSNLPVYQKNFSYVLLYFPARNKYILGEMRWWIASSIILLAMLIALGLSVFYLYRQKFLNEIQHDFIRNVTHEFQTPLTTLTVGLDAMSKPSVGSHPEKMEKYIKVMQGQTTYLKQHIDNLMRVLTAEAKGLTLEKGLVSPNELIRTAIMQLYLPIEEKNADIRLELEEKDSQMSADASSLYVAILNVISNAIKYADQPVICIKTELINNRYRIVVKDNGVGIDPQDYKKIFKKFYRIPTGDVHSGKGLGLGLYFVKKVISDHKGSIHINSTKGKGSEFIIELNMH